MPNLNPGDKAPAFSLKNQSGEKVNLKDFLGKKVVIFFYPQDNTPTCTKEACNLRDNYAVLKKKNIAVLGISPDDEVSHQKFIEQQKLPFTLLADVDKKVIDKYGVWGEKTMFANKYMGLLRTTFLINEKGVIDHIIKKVRSSEHTDQILKIWKI